MRKTLLWLLAIVMLAFSPAPLVKDPVKPYAGGTLLAVGGESNKEIYDLFMKLAGGPKASVIWIPTAMDDTPYDRQEFIEMFEESVKTLGFQNVTVLHTNSRMVADTDEFVRPIKEANGVWISGGRQWRLADAYLNTQTQQELQNLLKRGGIIGGNSAGATIMGSFLARGDSKTNTIMMGDHETGFAFLDNVAIDQHVIARHRQFDLIEIVEAHPHILGIGIDEQTAILIQGDVFEVVGKSKVLIYDAKRWDEASDSGPEHKFFSLSPGARFDLKARKVLQ